MSTEQSPDAARLRQVGPRPGEKQPDAPPPPKKVILENMTGHHVVVSMGGGETVAFHLAPWGTRLTDEEQLEGVNLEPWIKRSIIDQREWAPAPTSSVLVAFGAFVGVGVWALVIWAVWVGITADGPPDAYWSRALIVMGLAGAAGGVSSAMAEGRLHPKDLLLQLGASTGTLMGVVVISVGLPAVAILVGGSWTPVPGAFGPPTLEITGETLREAAAGAWRWTEGQDPQRLLGSLLQLVFITTAALLPARFYFQFDRHKLSTLRQRFFRSVVIIDPDTRTLEDAKSVYEARADDTLGRPHSEGRSPSQGMMRQGIIVTATILVTLGWIVTLSPMSAGGADAPPTLLAYFEPDKNVFVFAFLERTSSESPCSFGDMCAPISLPRPTPTSPCAPSARC